MWFAEVLLLSSIFGPHDVKLWIKSSPISPPTSLMPFSSGSKLKSNLWFLRFIQFLLCHILSSLRMVRLLIQCRVQIHLVWPTKLLKLFGQLTLGKLQHPPALGWLLGPPSWNSQRVCQRKWCFPSGKSIAIRSKWYTKNPSPKANWDTTSHVYHEMKPRRDQVWI